MTETAVATPRLVQRLGALERANEIRLARADLKRRIGRGQVTPSDVLIDPPGFALSWPIGEMLLAQRRWGPTRVRKFCVRNQVSETKSLGALTERQCNLLAGQLRAAHMG